MNYCTNWMGILINEQNTFFPFIEKKKKKIQKN